MKKVKNGDQKQKTSNTLEIDLSRNTVKVAIAYQHNRKYGIELNEIFPLDI